MASEIKEDFEQLDINLDLVFIKDELDNIA